MTSCGSQTKGWLLPLPKFCTVVNVFPYALDVEAHTSSVNNPNRASKDQSKTQKRCASCILNKNTMPSLWNHRAWRSLLTGYILLLKICKKTRQDMRKGNDTAGCQLGSVAVGTHQRTGAGRTVPTSQPLLLLQVVGGILPPSLAKKAALQTPSYQRKGCECRHWGPGAGWGACCTREGRAASALACRSPSESFPPLRAIP